MTKKTSLLYIMGVDWSWIRQRPHILAQELDKKFDTTVLYPTYLTRPWRRQKRTQKPKRCKAVFQIPFESQAPLLGRMEEKIMKRAFADADKYDMIWLCAPAYYKYVPQNYRGTVIYDCMDDNVKLQPNTVLAQRMRDNQQALWDRADLVFVTSQYLMDHLPEPVKGKAALVRNGTDARRQAMQGARPDRKSYVLGYIGTISEWFDFDLVEACLQKFSELKFELYGPAVVRVPAINGLCCKGVIEHGEIAQATKHVDCLMMPFVVNDIVLAVDPVKLYEYISMGKCIISVEYPEVERFEPYVYFYKTKEQLLALLKMLVARGFPPKYNAGMQQQFLDRNGWNERVNVICLEIDKCRCAKRSPIKE